MSDIHSPTANNTVTTDPRELAFIQNLATCKTIKAAAIKAGYSQETASSAIYTKLYSKSFQSKLREYYQGFAHTFLPGIAKIEHNVLKACLEDVNKVPKHARTLKEIKQAAKILSPDIPTALPTIHVDQVQVLMQQIQESKLVTPKPLKQVSQNNDLESDL